MNQFAHLEAAAVTDVGHRRKNNEDSLLICPEHAIFAVADGMGGGDDGEFASAAFVRQVATSCKPYNDRLRPLDSDAKIYLVRLAANQACRDIRQRMREKGTSGTGTTAVTIVFDAADVKHAVALHAGDSRLYRLRSGRLKLITSDHSVGSAVGIKKEDDLPAMFRGVITRAVGLADSVDLELTELDIAENDVLVLCSDGLDRMVPDSAIRRRLRGMRKGSANSMARALVDDALAAGGKDNVTVLVIKVGPLPEPVVTENPLYDSGGSGSRKDRPPTTITNDPMSPGSSDRDGQGSTPSDSGLPDDQDYIEGRAIPSSGDEHADTPTTVVADGNGRTGLHRRQRPSEEGKDQNTEGDVTASLGWSRRAFTLFHRRFHALACDLRRTIAARPLIAGMAAALTVLLIVAGALSVRWLQTRDHGTEASAKDPSPATTSQSGLVVVERGTYADRSLPELWHSVPEMGGDNLVFEDRFELPAGEHSFRWERDGFEDQRQTVRVEAGAVTRLQPDDWVPKDTETGIVPQAEMPDDGAETQRE